MNKITVLIIPFLLLNCQFMKDQKNTDPIGTNPPGLTYLALGDSYTIGERVQQQERFPNQLGDSLTRRGMAVSEVKIVARTGWTTDELIAAIPGTQNLYTEYDFVTLLIGVNNQFRGYPLDAYEKEFETLLKTAIRFAGNKPERVFVLSIPDYGGTPFGQARGNANQVAADIDRFNLVKQRVATTYGVAFFDITPISRRALNEPKLIAEDNLHPSGEMYRQWVALLAPRVAEVLK